jgi:hypothetical protein
MKTLFKYTWPVVALCALAACADDDNAADNTIVDPHNGKELIEFSGEGSPLTRASLTRAGFHASEQTEIMVKIVATDKRTGTGFPKTSRNTVTWATASATKTDTEHSVAGLLGAGFEHSDVTYKTDASYRYWDDAFGRKTNLSVYAVAVPGKTGKISANSSNATKLNTDGSEVDNTVNPNWHESTTNVNTLPWAVSQAQTSSTMADEDLTFSNNIRSTGNGGRYTHTCTDATNNTWSTSMANGELTWIPKTSATDETTGKFDQGHLIFNHALSQITINLTEGNGFSTSTSSDFAWTGGSRDQNITLMGFTLSGTLDVATGLWSSTNNDVKDITYMAETTTGTNTITRTVKAYCLPGRDLSAASSNVIKFQIDNNDYYVTGSQILKAIHDYYDAKSTTEGANNYDKLANTHNTASNFTTMVRGEHYVINLTVGKKQIDNITAQVLDWENVNSNTIEPSNVSTSFTLEDRGTPLTDGDGGKFYLYRAKKTTDKIITDADPVTDATVYTNVANYDWLTGYNAGDSDDLNNTNTNDGNSARANKSYSSDHWTTTWYWPNNKTWYHFRAVGDYAGNNLETNFVKTEATTGDYFGITSGSAYKDYIWGAPFKDIDTSAKLTYSTNDGFDNASGDNHQISKGISVTGSTIRMLLFHVTSQIFVKVQTVADDRADKVTLSKTEGGTTIETQVKLLRLKKDGTVLMGNGLVSPTGDVISSDAMELKTSTVGNTTINAKENIGSDGIDAENFFYGVVPQELSRGNDAADKVGLQIITPDGNEYFIQDLSTYAGTVSTTNLTNPYSPVDANDKSKGYIINSWRPHYQYFYTITIKKTGIANITAAVLPWEEVRGDLGTIDLEN